MSATTARAHNFYTVPKSRPKSAAKRNRRKQILHRGAFLVITLLTVLTLTRLVQEVLHAQTLTLVNQQKMEIEKALKHKEDLEFKLGLMKAPGRIKSIAVNKLGMIETKKAGYLVIPYTFSSAKSGTADNKPHTKLASTLGSIIP